MSGTTSSGRHVPNVRDLADHVEITGMSKKDVVAALELWEAAGGRQARSLDALRRQLTHAMVDTGMPLVPEPSQRQAQRAAALREGLLEQGFETYASLAVKRSAKESSVRTWATRARRDHRLFTVRVGGQTIVPAVQLTASGEILPEVAALIAPLLRAGLDNWSLWAWLCSPSDRLSGQVPADVARTANPDRARRAALRHAQQIADVATGAT